MNKVLRVLTGAGSFIIKQARPWVEKYPTIEAPVDRSDVEAKYLMTTNSSAMLRPFSPKLLFQFPKDFIIITEDLGQSSDFTFIYESSSDLEDEYLELIIAYIKRQHSLPLGDFPLNLSMRKLNHEHIFIFPFVENSGFDLEGIQKGLQDVALPFQRNADLKTTINRWGQIYLAQGRTLIHGDYYPGSWLQTSDGIRIIDAEFAFHGPPEFDLAVLTAHLYLAQQSKSLIAKVTSTYQAEGDFDFAMYRAYTGIEIMRRLIGVAQLPLTLSISQKINLMAKAHHLIMQD